MGGSPYLGVRMDEKADDCRLGGVTEPRTRGGARPLANGPAYRAGLRTGDVIVRFAGHEVGSYEEMVKLLKEQKPYDEVVIEAKRGDEVKEFKVTIGLSSRRVIESIFPKHHYPPFYPCSSDTFRLR